MSINREKDLQTLIMERQSEINADNDRETWIKELSIIQEKRKQEYELFKEEKERFKQERDKKQRGIWKKRADEAHEKRMKWLEERSYSLHGVPYRIS